jgi:uncharacterized membrane protein
LARQEFVMQAFSSILKRQSSASPKAFVFIAALLFCSVFAVFGTVVSNVGATEESFSAN